MPTEASIPKGEGERAAIRVDSFTEPGVTYVVSPAFGECTCPAHQHRGGHCKHLVLAEALVAIRKHAARVPSFRVGLFLREQEIGELVRELYAKKERTPAETYGLLCKAEGLRFATERIRQKAREVHARAIENEGRAA